VSLDQIEKIILSMFWSCVCYPLSVTFDNTGILWIGGSIAVDSEKQTGQIHAISYSPEI
jgi:hypothetical protein